jgi:Cft2 family RNA processing exonuclease
MTRQRDELGIREYPLYSHHEVDDIAPLFQGFKYNREIEWAAFNKTRGSDAPVAGRGTTSVAGRGVAPQPPPSPTLEFFDAGHALGSAGILVRGRKETLFYTGDVCFHDQTIQKRARFEDVRADVLIMETTRGDRATPRGFTRAAEVERLSRAIQQALKRKGSVLIPTFALGRTQEILALLALLIQEGRLKPQPIYIGGLGRVFTEIYDLESHRAHRQHPDLQLHETLNLVVLEQGEAEKMKLTGGKLFVITAGMMSENTAAHDLALRMIGDERMAVFFVGYTDPDTPGGRLRASRPGQRFLLSPSGGEVTRRCDVQEFDLTAHAQREDLLAFVGQVAPRAVLLGHGEEASRKWFEGRIRARWPKIKIIQPEPGKSVEA